MYGMVNEAVKGLVLSAFGKDAWEKIHTQANSPESFVSLDSYDDAVTYNLVGAASEVLQLDAGTILVEFGKYWVAEVATVHYAELMSQTGDGIVPFLDNLDAMHQRMKSMFPNYQPPSFRVLPLEEEGLFQVDYYSKREGLLPFVEGLFQGLAIHFKETLEIEHVPDDSHPLPCKRMTIRIGK